MFGDAPCASPKEIRKRFMTDLTIKYEYKSVETPFSHLVEVCNTNGADGWKLVYFDYNVAILEREVKAKKKDQKDD